MLISSGKHWEYHLVIKGQLNMNCHINGSYTLLYIRSKSISFLLNGDNKFNMGFKKENLGDANALSKLCF